MDTYPKFAKKKIQILKLLNSSLNNLRLPKFQDSFQISLKGFNTYPVTTLSFKQTATI